MQGNAKHTEPSSQGVLTCMVIHDAHETQDKVNHIQERHDKGGQKVTKWRGGCREESPRREMTRGQWCWGGDRVSLQTQCRKVDGAGVQCWCLGTGGDLEVV